MKIDLNKIFFCTGARNHDLLKFFKSEKVKFEYDERMASFMALGLAKISSHPVAVCTTSGTAVSECISAMVEAYYSQVPLVLISGDRPKKLHGSGSPQTIEHEKLTRSCRRSFIEIDISKLADLELTNIQYPLHINVLIDDTISHDEQIVYEQDLNSFGEFIKHFKRPLFIFSHEEKSMEPFIRKFSLTGIPFYAETLSGGRHHSIIKTEKKLVELFNAKAFDSIIRVGHTPLSKLWRLLEKKLLPVFSFDARNLSGLSYGQVLPMDSKALESSDFFWDVIKNLSPQSIEDNSLATLDELTNKYPLGEISFFKKLQKKLQKNNLIYLGNSLVVRFFELTQTTPLRVFGNRGVNGIDGQLATAIGLAYGSQENVFCILGDITTFYDLSSLREMPHNLFLIIMNNKGGRIFDMLSLDKRIILEHESDFKNISKSFNLSYSTNLEDFGKVQVLELFPDRVQSELMLKEWSL